MNGVERQYLRSGGLDRRAVEIRCRRVWCRPHYRNGAARVPPAVAHAPAQLVEHAGSLLTGRSKPRSGKPMTSTINLSSKKRYSTPPVHIRCDSGGQGD